MDDQPSAMPVEWFIAFTPTRPRWFNLLCRPGFRHCLAFRFDRACGTWVWAEMHSAGMRIEALHGFEIDHRIATISQGGGCFLRYRVPLGARGQSPRLLYCVPFVSHLLGLPGSALSPYGLYRRLLAAGAKPAFTSVRS